MDCLDLGKRDWDMSLLNKPPAPPPRDYSKLILIHFPSRVPISRDSALVWEKVELCFGGKNPEELKFSIILKQTLQIRKQTHGDGILK